MNLLRKKDSLPLPTFPVPSFLLPNGKLKLLKKAEIFEEDWFFIVDF